MYILSSVGNIAMPDSWLPEKSGGHPEYCFCPDSLVVFCTTQTMNFHLSQWKRHFQSPESTESSVSYFREAYLIRLSLPEAAVYFDYSESGVGVTNLPIDAAFLMVNHQGQMVYQGYVGSVLQVEAKLDQRIDQLVFPSEQVCAAYQHIAGYQSVLMHEEQRSQKITRQAFIARHGFDPHPNLCRSIDCDCCNQ